MNLFTRMKSPTSSVGRIDDEGILNGSARNERSTNTTSRTGKNDFEYSTHTGSAAPGARRAAKNSRSTSQTMPVTAVSTNRIRAKFIESQEERRGNRLRKVRRSAARHCRTEINRGRRCNYCGGDGRGRRGVHAATITDWPRFTCRRPAG